MPALKRNSSCPEQKHQALMIKLVRLLRTAVLYRSPKSLRRSSSHFQTIGKALGLVDEDQVSTRGAS
jgi:hypothetical protein